MTHFHANYTRADGTAGVLDLIARNCWEAYAALFDALADDVSAVRLKRRA